MGGEPPLPCPRHRQAEVGAREAALLSGAPLPPAAPRAPLHFLPRTLSSILLGSLVTRTSTLLRTSLPDLHLHLSTLPTLLLPKSKVQLAVTCSSLLPSHLATLESSVVVEVLRLPEQTEVEVEVRPCTLATPRLLLSFLPPGPGVYRVGTMLAGSHLLGSPATLAVRSRQQHARALAALGLAHALEKDDGIASTTLVETLDTRDTQDKEAEQEPSLDLGSSSEVDTDDSHQQNHVIRVTDAMEDTVAKLKQQLEKEVAERTRAMEGALEVEGSLLHRLRRVLDTEEPGEAEEVTKVEREEPKFMKEVAKVVKEVPKAVKEVPKVSKEVPMGMKEVPMGVKEVLQGMKEVIKPMKVKVAKEVVEKSPSLVKVTIKAEVTEEVPETVAEDEAAAPELEVPSVSGWRVRSAARARRPDRQVYRPPPALYREARVAERRSRVEEVKGEVGEVGSYKEGMIRDLVRLQRR